MPAPMFMPPQGGYAPQQQAVPRSQAGGYVPPRLVPPAKRQAETPAPVVRGVRGSEPARREADIPTPEELGIGSTAPAKAEPLDWSAIRRQMTDLGVVRFDVQQLGGGRVRFSCWVGDAGRLVQADGATEADAVRQGLARAKMQASAKR